jgi:hypothetical protein
VKVRVTLNLNGRVFTDIIEARDYQDAKDIAKRRNSKSARVIAVTAVYG